jgi:hypothetical protein
MARKAVRGWQFWRRAFWTRPILLAVYALLLGTGGLLTLLTVPSEIDDALGMMQAADCPPAAVRPQPETAAPQGCLERVPVMLSGPHYSRGPGSEWWMYVNGRSELYADVDVPTAGSRRLSGDTTADGLFWEGEPVAIEQPRGRRIETDNWGHPSWLLRLFLGMFVLSGSLMLLLAARLKRRTASGWWSVDGEQVGFFFGMTPLMAVACLLAAPALLGFLPLVLGAGTAWAVALALTGLALAIFAIVKQFGEFKQHTRR